MDYKFYFDNAKDAEYFCDRVSEIAKEYGEVQLADLYDLTGGSYSYLASTITWTADTILFGIHYDRGVDGRYYVNFPEPEQYQAPAKRSYKYYYSARTPHGAAVSKQTPTPEPLNITLNIPDITRSTVWYIADIIQQANEIKDRPVFVTIN